VGQRGEDVKGKREKTLEKGEDATEVKERRIRTAMKFESHGNCEKNQGKRKDLRKIQIRW